MTSLVGDLGFWKDEVDGLEFEMLEDSHLAVEGTAKKSEQNRRLRLKLIEQQKRGWTKMGSKK